MKRDAQGWAEATGGAVVHEAAAGELVTDTRAIEPGQWFLAIEGARFDGHDFAAQAIDAGAVGVVVHRDITRPDGSPWRGGLVRVDDTTAALARAGTWVRRTLTVPVVGLTGSSGKTTTRALIALAIGARGRVHQTVGNLNNHWGVPMTLVATPPDADALVVEMGTSGPGEIEHLARMGEPDHRLIVNVGPAHLEELGGLDGVAVEKGAMFATARAGDTLYVNLDDPRVRGWATGDGPAWQRPADGTRILGWGRADGAVVRLLDVAVDAVREQTSARWATPEGEVATTLPGAGEHLALNATAALAIAHGLGLDLADAAARLAAYAPVGMRQRLEALPGGAVAVNDAYNANPASVEAALRTLVRWPGRTVAVLGDMLELGTEEARYHSEIAALAVGLGVDRVVLIGERMAAAAASLPEPARGRVLAAVDGLSLVPELRGWLREGDRVLFKGSRGARVERILQALQAEDGS